jgi:hypothetical protein
MDEIPSLQGVRLDDETLIWEPEGSGRRFLLEVDAIDELHPVVMKGYAAVPKRGAEVGGLLIGGVQPDGTTRIAAFVPVAVEYAYGPSFQLSTRDRKLMEGKVVSMKAAGKTVVGMYRSNTRPKFELVASDIELFESFFSDPATCLLLIQPSMTRPTYAALLDQSQIARRQIQPRNQFPFRRRDLGLPVKTTTGPSTTGPYPRPEELLPIEVAAEPEPLAAPQPTPAPPVRATIRLSSLIGYLLVTLVGLGLGGVIGYQQGLKVGLNQSYSQVFSLPITAVRLGNEIIVQWPPASPAVRNALAGRLVLDDGRKPPTLVDLTPDQLRSGEAIYQDPAASLRGRLELRYEREQSFSAPFQLAP